MKVKVQVFFLAGESIAVYRVPSGLSCVKLKSAAEGIENRLAETVAAAVQAGIVRPSETIEAAGWPAVRAKIEGRLQTLHEAYMIRAWLEAMLNPITPDDAWPIALGMLREVMNAESLTAFAKEELDDGWLRLPFERIDERFEHIPEQILSPIVLREEKIVFRRCSGV